MEAFSGWRVLAALLTGLAVAVAATLVVRPTRRLAPRLRPYTIVSRTSLGRSADVLSVAAPGSVVTGGTLRRLFGPMVEALAERLGRLADATTEENMLLKLRQAGMLSRVPEAVRLREYRVRQLGNVASYSAAAVAAGLVLGSTTRTVLLYGLLGFVIGVTRSRGRLERAIEERRLRMRIEIYTVNQLLAMRVRVGGGVLQAVGALVERGTGAVVEELAEALRLHRAGLAASAAFGRAAKLTPEPHCARTYALVAAAEERGADLAEALLALSEDVREARREALRRAATRRRAAMLVPTIAILAPIMLLFVGAPIPRLVLGWR